MSRRSLSPRQISALVYKILEYVSLGVLFLFGMMFIYLVSYINRHEEAFTNPPRDDTMYQHRNLWSCFENPKHLQLFQRVCETSHRGDNLCHKYKKDFYDVQKKAATTADVYCKTPKEHGGGNLPHLCECHKKLDPFNHKQIHDLYLQCAKNPDAKSESLANHCQSYVHKVDDINRVCRGLKKKYCEYWKTDCEYLDGETIHDDDTPYLNT